MLSDLSIVQFIVVQASFAFSPGLIIALIVNESIQNSRRKGFEVAGGAALGGLILAFISASIVTFLYSAIPIFLQIIYLFGSVFILYKGLSILTRKDIETKKQSFKNDIKGPERKMKRNEPCYCGSGKKFKHCHGSL